MELSVPKNLSEDPGNPMPVQKNPSVPSPAREELAKYAAKLVEAPLRANHLPMNAEAITAVGVVTALTLRAAYNRGREDERNGVPDAD